MRFAAVMALLGLLSGPATAAVEILEAQGYLGHWVIYDGQHGPCAGASWSHEPEEGLTFDLQATSYDGSCIVSNWAGRCDGDGFLFSGELLPVTEGILGWFIHLQSQIIVQLEMTAPARISAIRSAEGIYSPGLHTVFLTLPDGSTEVLLGSDDGVNSAERMLGVGIHSITFFLDSDASWQIPFSYSGLVIVNWENVVGLDSRTWGGIKCLYRSSVN